MNGRFPAAVADIGFALLERAVGYTLGSLFKVTEDHLTLPTPCAGWDLVDLLRHMDESLLTLIESARGRLDMSALPPADDGTLIEPVARLRDRACWLLGAWTAQPRPAHVTVGDLSLHGDILAGAGALEITVHGWDVARTIGYDHPMPPALAEDLLMLSAVLVTPADRPGRFGPSVDVPPNAGLGDQLVAFLGRDPAAKVAP